MHAACARGRGSAEVVDHMRAHRRALNFRARAAAAAMPVRTPVLGASFHAVAATLLCMATTHSLAVAL